MSKRSEYAIADVFSALSDKTRLSLITTLIASPGSATSLAEGVPVTRQAILKHLHVLESVGLVVHMKQGREVLYTLDLRRFEEARSFLEQISADWDRAIARLRDFVEE